MCVFYKFFGDVVIVVGLGIGFEDFWVKVGRSDIR